MLESKHYFSGSKRDRLRWSICNALHLSLSPSSQIKLPKYSSRCSSRQSCKCKQKVACVFPCIARCNLVLVCTKHARRKAVKDIPWNNYNLAHLMCSARPPPGVRLLLSVWLRGAPFLPSTCWKAWWKAWVIFFMLDFFTNNQSYLWLCQ